MTTVVLVSLLSFLAPAPPTHNSAGPGRASETGRKNPLLRITVNHYRAPCTGESARLCYVVKIGDGTEWEFFYNSIVGFDTYRWGHTYDLIVLREQVQNPPQDGSIYRYSLVRVVSEEMAPATTEFSFTLKGDDIERYLTGSSEEGFRLFDAVAITCQTEKLCAALTSARTVGRSVETTFRHARDGIVLVSLVEVR